MNPQIGMPICQGLFVLTLGREGLVTLRNDSAFRPQDFAADASVKKVTP